MLQRMLQAHRRNTRNVIALLIEWHYAKMLERIVGDCERDQNHEEEIFGNCFFTGTGNFFITDMCDGGGRAYAYCRRN